MGSDSPSYRAADNNRRHRSLVSAEENSMYERNPLFYQLYLAYTMQTQLDTFYKQKAEAYDEQVQNQLLDTQWWTSNSKVSACTDQSPVALSHDSLFFSRCESSASTSSTTSLHERMLRSLGQSTEAHRWRAGPATAEMSILLNAQDCRR